MQYEITAQVKQQIPSYGQDILAGIDDFLSQVAERGKQLSQLVLKDTDYIYLANSLQSLHKCFEPCGQIDYNGVKLVRKV